MNDKPPRCHHTKRDGTKGPLSRYRVTLTQQTAVVGYKPALLRPR